MYPLGIDHLLFYHLCVYHYADLVPAMVNEIQDQDGQVCTESITTNNNSKIMYKRKTKIPLLVKTDQ